MSVAAITNINRAMQSTVGGFTIEAESGRKFLPQTEAWLVGGMVPSLVLNDDRNCSFEALVKWYSRIKTITANPIVGGWENNGLYYLDFVTIVSNERDARMLGKMWGEIAVGQMDNAGTFKELVLN